MPLDNTPEQLVEKVQATMKEMNESHKKIVADLQATVNASGDQVKELIAGAEAAAKKQAAHSAAILELEQKLAEGVKAGKAAPETLGRIVIQSEAFKGYANGGSTKMRIEANTITGQDGTSPPANSDTLVAPDRMTGIISGAYRALKLRDLIPGGNTTSNMIQYVRELVATNNAAETAEGDNKPESSITFELINAPVATIATFLKLSKQVLSDSSQLEAYIDTRLRYFVDFRYDSQILNGNGVGQNISGILDSGNHTVFSPETGELALDSLNRAKVQTHAADFPANGLVMNPVDWGKIERQKVGSDDVRYQVGNPTGTLQPVLWGLPAVITNAMPEGKFLMANFDIAYMLFERQGTVVEMFEQDEDNVQKNLVTVRAEKRGALAALRPASAVAGFLTA